MSNLNKVDITLKQKVDTGSHWPYWLRVVFYIKGVNGSRTGERIPPFYVFNHQLKYIFIEIPPPYNFTLMPFFLQIIIIYIYIYIYRLKK